jgi:hypothetical protein
MFDGYLVLLPIQGAIVAVVFMVIGIVKIFGGVSGKESVKWNAIAIGCFMYLFFYGFWIAMSVSAV